MKSRILWSTVLGVLTICCPVLAQAQTSNRRPVDTKPSYVALMPDLVVKDITLNQGWAKGKGPRGISVLVANVGEGPSVACKLGVTIRALEYVVELNKSKPNKLEDSRFMDIPPLKPGQEQWIEQTYALLGAPNETPPTIQSVTAQADAVPTKVKESDETNNGLALKGDEIKPFGTPSSRGQARSPKPLDLTKLIKHPPDLFVRRVEFASIGDSDPNLSEKLNITVVIGNRGNKDFDSSYIKGRIQVWLRVWKPRDEQPFTDVEPKATSYIWGAVLEVSDLAPNEEKSVTFSVPKPPGAGGWEAIHSVPEGKKYGPFQAPKPTDYPPFFTWPLNYDLRRLRIVARVDPSNRIEESDESNNNGFIFEPIPY